MARRVRETGADFGVALDGDGDRIIMCDHTGDILDGDDLTFIIAQQRKARGLLKGSVVGTLMSNFGLERAVEQIGLGFERTKVGDRYILEMLKQNNWTLGGETSGHIICLDLTTTGDGIISALQVAAAMRTADLPLRDLREGLEKYPQRMINVKLTERCDVSSLGPVKKAVASVEGKLNGNGRVVLRPSGTEPVIRVMVEGPDATQVSQLTEFLADAVRDAVADIAPA